MHLTRIISKPLRFINLHGFFDFSLTLWTTLSQLTFELHKSFYLDDLHERPLPCE